MADKSVKEIGINRIAPCAHRRELSLEEIQAVGGGWGIGTYISDVSSEDMQVVEVSGYYDNSGGYDSFYDAPQHSGGDWAVDTGGGNDGGFGGGGDPGEDIELAKRPSVFVVAEIFKSAADLAEKWADLKKANPDYEVTFKADSVYEHGEWRFKAEFTITMKQTAKG